MVAGDSFLEKPMETPFIPSWDRVVSAMPDVLTRLKEAVEQDYLEYSHTKCRRAS
jgi:glucosyl-3-phosphoglycerate synthase